MPALSHVPPKNEPPARGRKHASADNQTKVYPSYAHISCGHTVQAEGTDIRSKFQQDCQQTKCLARADPVHYHKLYSILNTQIHKFGTASPIEMTAECDG